MQLKSNLSHVSQLSHLQNIRVSFMLNFMLHFYFQAFLKRLGQLPGSSVRGLGYPRSAARQPGRRAGVQPGGQPTGIARTGAPQSPKPRREITELTAAIAIYICKDMALIYTVEK